MVVPPGCVTSSCKVYGARPVPLKFIEAPDGEQTDAEGAVRLPDGRGFTVMVTGEEAEVHWPLVTTLL